MEEENEAIAAVEDVSRGCFGSLIIFGILNLAGLILIGALVYYLFYF